MLGLDLGLGLWTREALLDSGRLMVATVPCPKPSVSVNVSVRFRCLDLGLGLWMGEALLDSGMLMVATVPLLRMLAATRARVSGVRLRLRLRHRITLG